jgi:hypothetical protein
LSFALGRLDVVEVVVERFEPAVLEQRKLVRRPWIAIDIRRGSTSRRVWISADICLLRRGVTGRISIGIGLIGYLPTLTAL